MTQSLPPSWKAEYFEILNRPNVADVDADAALLLKTLNLPRFLYRYRSFDAKGRALKNLESGLDWLAEPKSFNDPFDSSLSFSIETILDRWYRDRLVEVLSATGHLAKFTAEEVAEIQAAARPVERLFEIITLKEDKPLPPDYQRVVAGIRDAMLGAALEKLAENSRDSLRVCCFCENATAPLMWGHYADKHTGFCIEYEVQQLVTDVRVLKMLHPVHYSDRRFDATAHTHPDFAPNTYIPIIAACNKASDWAYESEWRFVLPGGIGKTVHEFGFARPTRIILGAKAEDGRFATLTSIPRLAGIPVVQARLSKTDFAIEF